MPLHGKVGEDEQDDESKIIWLTSASLLREIPRYRLAPHGVLPDTALQAVRDELILELGTPG